MLWLHASHFIVNTFLRYLFHNISFILHHLGTSFFDEMQAASSAAMALTSSNIYGQKLVKTNGELFLLITNVKELSFMTPDL